MAALKITEHIPVYASGFSEPETVEFESTEQLLNVEFVQAHSRQQDFYRYSINGRSSRMRVPILAEYNNGEKWVVIGFIDGDLEKIDLPEWNPSGLKIVEQTKPVH